MEMSPRCRTRGIVITAAAILLFPAFSQIPPNPPGAGTGSNVPWLPPGASADGTPNTNANRDPPPITVTGRVMLDDGTAPTSSVTIESVCGGMSHSEGRTDGRGYFSVQVGQTVGVTGDGGDTRGDFSQTIPHTSSLGHGFGPNDRFANCDLRAALGGYLSQSVNLANRGPLDNPDVGVILIHRIGESDQAITVTASTLKAPKAAGKALQKGMDLAKNNKPEEAIASLREAVGLDPEFAFAWNELGKLQMENGQAVEARRSLESAVKAEPRWPEPYLHLALLAVRSANWQEAAGVTDRLLRLDPFEYPQAFFFNAAANYNLKRPEAAEKSARSAEKLDTRHRFPQIERLLGAILAESQRYAEAADAFRRYLTLAPRAADAPEVRKQLDDLKSLAPGSSQAASKEQRP
jgi:tetratricopeptide (TPR) repeat protein